MSQTFYIDTNRQNASVKSNENNAEWEYKLSNVLQLPAGTEVSIQNMFLHKQGISGATIEILEDVTETINFSVYKTDNPHWLPKASFGDDSRERATITKSRAYVPSLCPFGLMNDRPVYNPFTGSYQVQNDQGHTVTRHFEANGQEIPLIDIEISNGIEHNGGKYYGEPANGQRIALFADDGRGNPRINGGEWHNLNDPYITGYSEYPLMAIYVDSTETYTDDLAGDYFNIQQARGVLPAEMLDDYLDDCRFKPYVKQIEIFIPKGVYSIGEIADLIDGQINGKYVDFKNRRDFYTDTYVNKQNNATFTGTLETSGIYTKAQAIDRYKCDENLLGSVSDGVVIDSGGAHESNNYPSADLLKVFSIGTYYAPPTAASKAFGNPRDPVFNLLNPSGTNSISHCGFNDHYNLPYYDPTTTTVITYKTATGQANATVPKYKLAYNAEPSTGTKNLTTDYRNQENSYCRGRPPKLPTEDQLFFIPVHYYNQLVKMWIHNDVKKDGTRDNPNNDPKLADQNAYLIATDNWTLNTKRQFRYGFQTRVNNWQNTISPKSGLDCGENDSQIGLHYIAKRNTQPDYIDPASGTPNDNHCAIGVNPVQFNYDPLNNGYYVGTPDFSFSYDSDKSAFSISGLGQMCRVPSADIEGNPMASEGQTAVYVRRAPKFHEDIFSVPKRTLDTIANYPAQAPADMPQYPTQAEYQAKFTKEGGEEGFKTRIINTMNANEDRKGGVAIYNWAYNTALKYGDIIPATFKQADDSGEMKKMYHNDYQHLWKYDDFFSSKALAKKTWEKTLWFKLGFTYENLQDDEEWENIPYYDLPTNQYSNEPDPEVVNDPTKTGHDITMSRRANTYYQFRDNMYFKNEDFKMYGKSTKGELTVDSSTSISTAFNNLTFAYSERQATGKAPPAKGKDGQSQNSIHQVLRTYDSCDVSKPFFGNIPQIVTEGHSLGDPNPYPQIYPSGAYNYDNNVVAKGLLSIDSSEDLEYTSGKYAYDNSMYLAKTRVPILTESKSIISTKLPQLSEQGYYIITSDIIDYYQDDIKQGQPLPLVGIVPISNLSNQDFIAGDTDIIHTLQQVKNLNSIKVKILKPDLTAPDLLENSSIIFKITTPLPQVTPLIQQQGEDSVTENQEEANKRPQPNPHSN